MTQPTLVAGIDSSTQSCKVIVRDMEGGSLVREGKAPHPPGTEVDPSAWWQALLQAVEAAGGLEDVAAVSVGAQQHGMVCLDEDGNVVRPALLWNDTRSAQAADDLLTELGGGEKGGQAWVDAVGSVPVASFTVTKLRWLAAHEPGNAARTAAVCLPHDWLTWKLAGARHLDGLRTDRGDASGTGYWSAESGEYRMDLLTRAFGRTLALPDVLAPAASAGETPRGTLLGAGTGDNAGAALGLATAPGDVVVSVGTSGVVSVVTDIPVRDASGTVAGFADATGRYLPLACTLNASRVLDATARLLGVDHAGLSDLALEAPAGADGLVVVPYLEGERTPNRPEATGAVHGLTLDAYTPANLARATIEGLLCGLADALQVITSFGVPVERVLLVGGAARSPALQQFAPAILAHQVHVPAPSEYVADGAARQAAWALSGLGNAPRWEGHEGTAADVLLEPEEHQHVTEIRRRYAEARDLVIARRELR